MPQSGSPEVLEEDEAELELQKQLEKGRRLRQLQQLRDSGEKVRRLRGLGAGGRCLWLLVLGGTRSHAVTGGPRVLVCTLSVFHVVLLVGF